MFFTIQLISCEQKSHGLSSYDMNTHTDDGPVYNYSGQVTVNYTLTFEAMGTRFAN